jgi:hypothetical protein
MVSIPMDSECIDFVAKQGQKTTLTLIKQGIHLCTKLFMTKGSRFRFRFRLDSDSPAYVLSGGDFPKRDS